MNLQENVESSSTHRYSTQLKLCKQRQCYYPIGTDSIESNGFIFSIATLTPLEAKIDRLYVKVNDTHIDRHSTQSFRPFYATYTIAAIPLSPQLSSKNANNEEGYSHYSTEVHNGNHMMEENNPCEFALSTRFAQFDDDIDLPWLLDPANGYVTEDANKIMDLQWLFTVTLDLTKPVEPELTYVLK